MSRRLLLVITQCVLMAVPGCGYSLQTSQNPALIKQGVRKVYVAPLVNNSYKPGVENLLYNALVRSLASNRRITVVQRAEEADAILRGTISNASYSETAGTRSASIYPVERATIDVEVATEYQAVLSCDFKLIRTHALDVPIIPEPTVSASPAPVTAKLTSKKMTRKITDKSAEKTAEKTAIMTVQLPVKAPAKSAAGSLLWGAAFTRLKRFPGNNQKDEFGTTSPLINESEFDRALRDIALGMMGDVNESMLAMF